MWNLRPFGALPFALILGCASPRPAPRNPAALVTAKPTTAADVTACARSYTVAFDDAVTATRALLESPRYQNTLVVTQVKPIFDTIARRLDPGKIDSLDRCRALAGELRLNVLDLRQALIELANVPRANGRGPLVQNATITAIMYARVSDRLRRIIY